MPAHEIQIQLKDLKPLIADLRSQAKLSLPGNRLLKEFDAIDKIIGILGEVSDGALELGKKEKSVFSLRSVVDFSLKIKAPELQRASVKVEVAEKAKFSLDGYPNFVMNALNNLIDNSIWWLQKKSNERKVKITLKRNADGYPIIIVSDNGPGLNPEDIPYLGDAFYTRKPRGTGLGLFISRRSMEANGGKIDFGFYPTDSDYLSGANVLLIFEDQSMEIKE
jgi:signal transduction histidine kinase